MVPPAPSANGGAGSKQPTGLVDNVVNRSFLPAASDLPRKYTHPTKKQQMQMANQQQHHAPGQFDRNSKGMGKQGSINNNLTHAAKGQGKGYQQQSGYDSFNAQAYGAQGYGAGYGAQQGWGEDAYG